MIDSCSVKPQEQQTSVKKMTHLDRNNNNNNKSNSGSRCEEKYGLRPRTIIKRLQQERVREEVPKKTVRSKSRPAPLSKYRRKTANARERHRMKEINNAFDSLRKVLPDAFEVPTTQSAMTKITTLRHAVNYIRALSEVLKAEDEGAELCSIQNSLQDSFQNCLDQSFQYTMQQSIQKNIPGEDRVSGIQSEQTYAYYTHHFFPQHSETMNICSFPEVMSTSSSPSTTRGSLSSASDLEELLSDDSGLLEDNIDVFHDIPMLCVADPLDIFLGSDKDGMNFSHELCS